MRFLSNFRTRISVNSAPGYKIVVTPAEVENRAIVYVYVSL